MKEKAQLEKTLEALRENSERQVSSRIKSLSSCILLYCSPFVLFYRHKGTVNVADLPKRRICHKIACLRPAASERHDSFLAEALLLVLELFSVL